MVELTPDPGFIVMVFEALAPVIALIVALGFYPKPALDVINPVAKATITKAGFTDPAPTVTGGGDR